ncbi:MAG: hypothetical protein JWO46_2325 [Nocardioidaceae bacterium]|nr:hypothetical protein [Nocardioidaceae bacterium]
MTSRSRLAVLPVSAAALLLVLTGCGGGGGDSSGTSSSSVVADGGGQVATSAAPSADQAVAKDGTAQERSVVSTGTVSLEGKDVAAARKRVDALLAANEGVVADENTTTDEKGRVDSATLTVRVPSARFAKVMAALGTVATLRDSTRQAQDVTTQVIDVQARVAAQEAGVKRLEELVGTSANLSELLQVEKELTQRRADLDSLKQQQAWLADQTSLATITVDISRTGSKPPVPATGFWGGLQNGWHAMTAFLAGTALATGAALPFVVLLLLVGVPVWLLVRRHRRARVVQTPEVTG